MRTWAITLWAAKPLKSVALLFAGGTGELKFLINYRVLLRDGSQASVIWLMQL